MAKASSNAPEQDVTAGAEIVLRGPSYDDALLLDISSFDDALAAVSAEMGSDAIATADNALGNGFSVLENKDTLIGLPLIFMGWNFNNGDFGDFVSATVVAKTEGGLRKVILNDGSTGIMKQLQAYTDRTGKMGGLVARNGLTRSDYTYEDPKDGAQRPASTYYIDTSA